MRTPIMLAALALSLGGRALGAQRAQSVPELRAGIGASIPAGSARDDYLASPIGVLQAALQATPSMHVVGTLSYVAGQSRYAVEKPNVAELQYDTGIELGAPREIGRGWTASPFVGVGGGVRVHDFRAPELKTRAGPVGYAAVGGELELDRGAIRVEARGNVARMRAPLAGAPMRARGDVALLFGLTYHLR